MMRKLQSFFSTHWAKLSIGIILLIAAVLRFYRIREFLTFLGDEGRDVLVAYNILHGHFTLLGPIASVGGFFLGPMYYYFMTPFLWLAGYDPVGPAIMVALAGILTVYLVYFLGEKWFSRPVGIIAASLYTLSPLVIRYSRSSWNPNLVPLFTLLIFWVLYQAGEKKDRRKLLLCGLLLGIGIQLHYLMLFVGVICAGYLLYVFGMEEKKRRLGQKIQEVTKVYLTVFAGFIIGLLPFLFFELRHQFLNIRLIHSFIFQSGGTGGGSSFFGIFLSTFFLLFGRIGNNLEAFPVWVMHATALQRVVGIEAVIVGIGGIALFLWQMRQGKKKHAHMLVALWLLGGLCLFGLYKKNIYDYYLGFLFPVPFLLLGNLVVWLWSKKGISMLLGASLVCVPLYMSYLALPFFTAPNNQVQQTEDIAAFVNEKTQGKPFNLAVISGGNSDFAYRYFLTKWNHMPVTILPASEDPKRTSVTDQLLVICESLPCAPLGHSLWEVAGFGQATISGQWKVSVVEIYHLKHFH